MINVAFGGTLYQDIAHAAFRTRSTIATCAIYERNFHATSSSSPARGWRKLYPQRGPRSMINSSTTRR